MKRVVLVGLALVLLLAPAKAVTQLGEARPACAEDIKQICGEVKPGESRLIACVEEHFGQLSAPARPRY